ncbi:MAG: efflux RND transporter permease subunit, partial [Deltaproteobacteria bacterium]|nr:efflux RND transporter permease subunit [Deltaproteobacteria bacterium]
IAARVDRVVPFYVGLLNRSFRHRNKVLFGGAAIFALSIVASALWLNVDFMAPSDVGEINLAVKVQPGTTIKDFDTLARRAEKEISAEVPEAVAVEVQFGETEGFGAFFGGQSATAGSIFIKLPPIKQRARRQSEIETAVLRRLASIPGITASVRQEMSFSSGTGDIEIKVVEDDLDKLREEAEDLVRRIEKLDGVRGVEFSMELGRPQLGVRLDREQQKALGLMPAEVVGSISSYYQGNKAGVFREKGDEYDILVRAPKERREDARLLGEVPLVTPAGKIVPLRAVATVSEDVGPVTIERYNQRRVGVVSVYKKPGTPLGPLSDEVKKITAGRTDIDIGGAASDMEESFLYLIIALAVSIFLVYGVMAALFESLLEPFVILFSIPVMWIGVAAMLILTRTTLQITALIGLIILVGIVVNNAIVLVDYLKRLRERGMPLVEAALEAGRARLRPVLMTACTTTLAMVPLALQLGEGSETWSPMARTVIGGLAASTILTLFIVPIVYVMIAGFLDRLRARRRPPADR